jgi:cytochrome c-type biogenesis protein CcmF
VKSYESERDVSLKPGESVELGGYKFAFEGVREVAGPNYGAARAAVTVTRDGAAVAKLAPEKRIYNVQRSPMTEAAIDAGFTRDVYVSLGDSTGDGPGSAWQLRVHVKPFVRWIWLGCILMGLGGLLAASDRRYRVPVRRTEVPSAADATLIAPRQGPA